MRKRRKRYTERPTVYIAQPDFEKPAASMQSEYRTPKKEPATNLTNKPEIPTRPKKTKRKITASIEKEQPIDEIEYDSDESVLELDEVTEENLQDESSDEIKRQDEQQDENKNSQNKKPFIDMSIAEQVDYLSTTRAHIPKMKCEITTESERYRGIISAVEADVVKIETLRRPKFHQVKLEEIHSIRLLGF